MPVETVPFDFPDRGKLEHLFDLAKVRAKDVAWLKTVRDDGTGETDVGPMKRLSRS